MPERQVLSPPDNLSREIGFYFAGMEEVREQVRDAVTALSGDTFDRPAFPGAHSIGALVMPSAKPNGGGCNAMLPVTS